MSTLYPPQHLATLLAERIRRMGLRTISKVLPQADGHLGLCQTLLAVEDQKINILPVNIENNCCLLVIDCRQNPTRIIYQDSSGNAISAEDKTILQQWFQSHFPNENFLNNFADLQIKQQVNPADSSLLTIRNGVAITVAIGHNPQLTLAEIATKLPIQQQRSDFTPERQADARELGIPLCVFVPALFQQPKKATSSDPALDNSITIENPKLSI